MAGALGGCCCTRLRVGGSAWGKDLQKFLLLPACPPAIPGDEVYSTIRKQEYNGKIPRFRRIRGESELYTSDTVMQSESNSDWVEGERKGVKAQGGRLVS